MTRVNNLYIKNILYIIYYKLQLFFLLSFFTKFSNLFLLTRATHKRQVMNRVNYPLVVGHTFDQDHRF